MPDGMNYAQQPRLGPGWVSQLEIALDRPKDCLRDALRRGSHLELPVILVTYLTIGR